MHAWVTKKDFARNRSRSLHIFQSKCMQLQQNSARSWRVSAAFLQCLTPQKTAIPSFLQESVWPGWPCRLWPSEGNLRKALLACRDTCRVHTHLSSYNLLKEICERLCWLEETSAGCTHICQVWYMAPAQVLKLYIDAPLELMHVVRIFSVK